MRLILCVIVGDNLMYKLFLKYENYRSYISMLKLIFFYENY